jgi:hypothetical protein
VTVNYDEFKAAFLQALWASGLSTIGRVPAEERLDLGSTDRSLVVYIEPAERGLERPFHVSGVVSWRWDALQTARTTTTEEDLLTGLVGRDGARALETVRPWLRIDVQLRAALEVGRSIPLPSPAQWTRWRREGASRSIPRVVTDDVSHDTAGGSRAVPAWQGEPEIHATCDRRGDLRLESLSLSAFQGIELPRVWDDPERKRDGDPHEQLTAMFGRVKVALAAWGEALDRLL